MSNKLSLAEQETIILWDNELDTASIYTHDPRLLRRLAELTTSWIRPVFIPTIPGCSAVLRSFRRNIRMIAFSRKMVQESPDSTGSQRSSSPFALPTARSAGKDSGNRRCRKTTGNGFPEERFSGNPGDAAGEET